jgi:hypothetical protein
LINVKEIFQGLDSGQKYAKRGTRVPWRFLGQQAKLGSCYLTKKIIKSSYLAVFANLFWGQNKSAYKKGCKNGRRQRISENEEVGIIF